MRKLQLPSVAFVMVGIVAILAAILVPALAGGDCGATWTARTSGLDENLTGVTWTGALVVVVSGGSDRILTSPDGVTWTPHNWAAGHGGNSLNGVTWTGAQLVAVGGAGAIVTSPDGATWTKRTSGVSGDLFGVCWTGTQLVAVGSGGTILTSPDGVTWTSQNSGVNASIYGVAGTSAMTVAGGNPVGPSMTILSSPEGMTWTKHPFSFGGWFGAFTAASGQFVGVGVSGAVFTSPDGILWTQRTSGTTSDLRGVTTAATGFVAVGWSGAILTSPDGITWTPRSSGTSAYLRGVTSAGSQLVAVGDNGTILTSPCSSTGYTYATWIPVASHTPGRLNTLWRSDLGLLNTGTVQANVQLELYNGGTPVTTTTYVPAETQLVVGDVVGQLGGSGSWAIQVLSDQPLKITSRTYNQTPAGTYGQDYVACTPDRGLAATQSAWLSQLTENAAYRSNIGIVNTGTVAASVNVELHDGAGGLLATYTVGLNPGDWKQETQPFLNKAHQTDMARGYAKITVTSGSGVFALASLIDNPTGDPTTITMVR